MINRFDGKYGFLSNFYPSPIVEDGITYPTVEHYFQAMKSLNIETRKKIAARATPGQAKRAGRNTVLRPDWEKIKDEVMYKGVLLKFMTHPELAQKLLDTKDEYLEEGNTWHDHYWGVCDGRGKNQLGKTLMKVREEIKVSDQFFLECMKKHRQGNN